MSKPKVGDIVEIEWRDAIGGGSWEELATVLAAEPVTVHSVGYLVKKTPEALTVIQSSNANRHVDHFLCIPRAWVQEVTVLDPRC